MTWADIVTVLIGYVICLVLYAALAQFVKWLWDAMR